MSDNPENELVQLALLYPHIENGGEGKSIKSESLEKSDTSFHAPLSVWTIPCPEKSEIANAIPARAA